MPHISPASPETKSFSLFQLLKPYIAKYKALAILAGLSIIASSLIAVVAGIGVRVVVDGIPQDEIKALEYLQNILYISLALVATYGVAKYIGGYFTSSIAARVTKAIRKKIFDNLLVQDFGYIEQQNSGEIQTRIISDTEEIGTFISNHIPSVLAAILALAGGVIGAIYISFKLTIIILLVGILTLVPMILIGKSLRAIGAKLQTAVAAVGALTGETFRNLKVMKAYNNENHGKEQFELHANEVAKKKIHSASLAILLEQSMNALITAGLITLLWISARDIFLGNFTFGELAGFTYFAVLIITAVITFVTLSTAINIVSGKLQKVHEYLTRKQHNVIENKFDCKLSNNIIFENVHFSYANNSNETVLNGLSFAIEAGSQVAIVGPSGAGKSTILELLLKFYQAQSGLISLDGKAIDNIDTQQLRSLFGYVPQQESLISGTVFENIQFDATNLEEDKVRDAAKLAHADEFIERLPQGYHTDLGEVGNRLSGGQKQRIALARALVRDPQVLLLDEPNSALDRQSELHIHEAIKQLSKQSGKTVVTIAHRLSTVNEADIILVVSQGKVVSSGRHIELLKFCDTYKDLVNSFHSPKAEHIEEIA